MIIQGLIDIVCTWVAGLISLMPPLPSVFSQGIGYINGGISWIANHVGGLGAVVPFDVLYSLALVWAGCWLFWLAMLALRLILWVLGR